MAITQTRTNTTATEQPRNQKHKEMHVEDQTNLSSMVKRQKAQVSNIRRHHTEEVMVLWQENAQLWEHNRSWQPKNETPVRVDAKSMTFEMPKTTNVSVWQNTHPQFVNTLGKQLQQFNNPFALTPWRLSSFPTRKTWLSRSTLVPTTNMSTLVFTSPNLSCTLLTMLFYIRCSLHPWRVRPGSPNYPLSP